MAKVELRDDEKRRLAPPSSDRTCVCGLAPRYGCYSTNAWNNAKPRFTGTSDFPFNYQLLGLLDCLGGVQALRAGLGAVHDRVAAVEPGRVLEALESVLRRLVPPVGQEAVGLEQDGGAEEAVAVPPVGRARRRAAEAEDALVEAVELATLLGALQPLLLG